MELLKEILSFAFVFLMFSAFPAGMFMVWDWINHKYQDDDGKRDTYRALFIYGCGALMFFLRFYHPY